MDAYTHRVLVLPRYYSMSMANCPWVGQGTLGPDMVSDTGQYLSSKVWLSGEYWNQVAAYMHELGHTNYLHHALQGGCPYCDASCLMVSNSSSMLPLGGRNSRGRAGSQFWNAQVLEVHTWSFAQAV